MSSVALDKTTANVAVNATVQLTATVSPTDATNKGINWTSSSDEKATVSDTGLVTGKAAGTVTITATSADDATKTASCEVTVTAE